MNKFIIFLCSKYEMQRERIGYANAFNHFGYRILNVSSESEFLETLEKYNSKVKLIINPESHFSLHPEKITELNIPTVIFQWDTYIRPKIRAKASLLYDIQVVCHPGFENLFSSYGCNCPILLPWCIDDTLIDKSENVIFTYDFDIGWVGGIFGKNYTYRKKILEIIGNGNFRINEFNKNYSWVEMINIYARSKIVVNTSRDDFPQDANMRCFEAMGSGALLFTSYPSELEKIGYIDGEHYISYKSISDFKEKVDYYLLNEAERKTIANNGQRITLNENTYKNRVENLLNIVESNNVIEKNNYRKKSRDEKLDYLSFAYLKDSDINNAFRLLSNKKSLPNIATVAFLIKLFLKRLIRLYI